MRHGRGEGAQFGQTFGMIGPGFRVGQRLGKGGGIGAIRAQTAHQPGLQAQAQRLDGERGHHQNEECADAQTCRLGTADLQQLHDAEQQAAHQTGGQRQVQKAALL